MTLFAKGFRPFFLLGAVHAALVMVLWVIAIRGEVVFDVGVSATAWHGHEMLQNFLNVMKVPA